MDTSRSQSAPGNSYLIISGHDFRSKRKASLHFITDELAKRGTTRFLSVGFSHLSKIKRDPRISLWSKANCIENYQGVDCYLWRSLLHPFNIRQKFASPFVADWFRGYVKQTPAIARRWIQEADTVLIESGIGVAFFTLVKELNPSAEVIYIASDGLETIGCAQFLTQELNRVAHQFDRIRLPSSKLASDFPPGAKLDLIAHGIDHDLATIKTQNPYRSGTNLVSVGSMLFDRTYFETACPAFPDAHFHVIGAGRGALGMAFPNLTLHDEMPFKETVAYIRHADAGIAPYNGESVAPYLVDTSMKLLQYGFLGVPAICPQVVAEGKPGRFGYVPGNAASILAATKAAIECGNINPLSCLTWGQVADRILEPQKYPDIHISRCD